AGTGSDSAQAEEPDPDRAGQRGYGGGGGGDNADPADDADGPEHAPPHRAFARSAERADERGYPLHDPGDADQQAEQRHGQADMADQHHAYHDIKKAGDTQPDSVLLFSVENPYQEEDPRDDRDDADQHGDHVE